mgnify:CR=1 FL=1
MKFKSHYRLHQRAFSLIESIMSISVLAITCPFVFAVIAQAGKSGLSSEAETRCAWIVATCLEEIRASREGCPQYFTATEEGDAFPPPDDVWALAFTSDGKVAGKISKADFENGAKESAGKSILYYASLSANITPENFGELALMNVKISISYPASMPQKRRDHLDFHTLIP